MQIPKRIELKQHSKNKSSRYKPFGLILCRFSYLAVALGFNIYENQWSVSMHMCYL